MNVCGVNIVRQTEIQTAEPLVNEPNVLDVEMAIEELKVKNHDLLIKFRQNCLKLELEQFVPRSISLLFAFGLTFWRRNYFLNFNKNVTNTGTKQVRIMKQTAF